MSRATEVVFLPGFDGIGSLRGPFLGALARRFRVAQVTYPNQALETLNGYGRFAAGHCAPEARPVLVAESFSGLVATRWASRDPHVAALVLCGAFVRNPMTWLTSLGASLPSAVQVAATLFPPMAATYSQPLRRKWANDLSRALRSLDPAVLAERLRLIAAEDVGAELSALRIPVVIVQFEGDLVIGPRARRELEASCAAADVVRIDGPHFAIETHPEQCAEAVAVRIGRLF